MIGILSYGAYIPPTRLPLSAIGGGSAKPEGPVPNIEGKLTLSHDIGGHPTACGIALVGRP